jgi:heme oxygenase
MQPFATEPYRTPEKKKAAVAGAKAAFSRLFRIFLDSSI